MLKHKLKKTTEKMYFGRKSGEKKKSNSKVKTRGILPKSTLLITEPLPHIHVYYLNKFKIRVGTFIFFG